MEKIKNLFDCNSCPQNVEHVCCINFSVTATQKNGRPINKPQKSAKMTTHIFVL